jgi:hypothetical protein
MTTANDFWIVPVTVVICAVTVMAVWLLTRRWARLKEEPEDPVRASAKEVAILVAREMYARGEFRRAVIVRVPSDLFSDDLVLACGHRSGTGRPGEEIEPMHV